jgi:hypothetical protein
VFGSATYMGNVSAGFQTFAEQTGRRCLNGSWRDKVAAGCTNSGAKSGDKVNTLVSLAIFAAQHHLHWVSLGLVAGWNSATGSENDLGAPVRCTDLPPPRPAGRPGDPATQRRPVRYFSGFISCSSVGTNSLTVGWMCMVREIAV